MWTPDYYREANRDQLVEIIRQFPFAAVTSHGKDGLKATHIPMIIDQEEPLTLISHMAKENEQWHDWKDGGEALAIFSGPHTYIDPSVYQMHNAVPTWNYIAAHARGQVTLIDDRDRFAPLMEKVIGHIDSSYLPQWNELNPVFIDKLFDILVWFEMDVTELIGQFKLSQEKPKPVQERIRNHLDTTNAGDAGAIAQLMRQWPDWPQH